MTTDNTVYYGVARPTTSEGDYNELRFLITQQLVKMETSLPVRVDEVRSGGLAPVGFVKVTVLVGQLSGDNKPFPGAQIDNVPYVRLQGGKNAVIIDPKPGDIGLACFASRDITAIKNARKSAPPGSKRHHNFSDAVYIGGMLNATPTQYIHFTDSGVVVHSPHAVTITSPNNTINGPLTVNGDAAFNGTLLNNGVDVGSTHAHSGITPGGGTTGTPV